MRSITGKMAAQLGKEYAKVGSITGKIAAQLGKENAKVSSITGKMAAQLIMTVQIVSNTNSLTYCTLFNFVPGLNVLHIRTFVVCPPPVHCTLYLYLCCT